MYIGQVMYITGSQTIAIIKMGNVSHYYPILCLWQQILLPEGCTPQFEKHVTWLWPFLIEMFIVWASTERRANTHELAHHKTCLVCWTQANAAQVLRRSEQCVYCLRAHSQCEQTRLHLAFISAGVLQNMGPNCWRGNVYTIGWVSHVLEELWDGLRFYICCPLSPCWGRLMNYVGL